jgi:hypothetical protein
MVDTNELRGLYKSPTIVRTEKYNTQGYGGLSKRLVWRDKELIRDSGGETFWKTATWEKEHEMKYSDVSKGNGRSYPMV